MAEASQINSKTPQTVDAGQVGEATGVSGNVSKSAGSKHDPVARKFYGVSFWNNIISVSNIENGDVKGMGFCCHAIQ